MQDFNELLDDPTPPGLAKAFAAKPNGRPLGSPSVSQLETPEQLVAEAKRVCRRAIRNAGTAISVNRARQILGMLKDISALEKDAHMRSGVDKEMAEMRRLIEGLRQ